MNKTNGIIIGLLVILIALVTYAVFRPQVRVGSLREEPVVVAPGPITPQSPTASSTNPKLIPPSNTFTNSAQKFSINYPLGFTSEESAAGGFYNETNLYNLSINVPASYQKNTDFNIGRVTVSVSPTITQCYSSSGSSTIDMTATKVINGITFHYNLSQPTDDSAMGGQRGKLSLFATIANNHCYRIEKQVGYRDLHGFTEPPYAPHFDEAMVNADLDAIITSIAIH